MKKRITFCVLAVALCASAALATTVTGTLLDASGAPVTNGSVTLQIENYGIGNIPRIINSGTLVSTQPVTLTANASGQIGGTVQGNDTITPASTYYLVTFYSGASVYSSCDYLITGSTFNLTAATCLATPPAVPPSIAYSTVAQSQNALQQRQILNFTGPGITCSDDPTYSTTDCNVTSGGGSGTVTSVGLALPSLFSVSGSPITTSGTLSASLASQSQNLVFASPNGSSGAPTFRALALNDLPAINFASLSGTATDGQLASAYSGVGSCAANQFAITLSRNAAPACASALTALTATAHQWFNAVSAAGVFSASQPAFSDISGTISAGQVPTLNQNTTGNAATASALAATPTQCAGGQFATGIAASGNANCGTPSGAGTVTSVGLSLPSIFSVSGSPVTASGTLTGTLTTQGANQVFAGPSSGSAAAPTFRALVAADIPALSYQEPLSTYAAPSNEFLTGFTSPNTFTAAQPAFSNLSGSATDAQLPADAARFTGTITAGDCAKWNSSGVLTDQGAACGSGGGSGTPGGASTQYQINNAGTFAGAAALTNSAASGIGTVVASQAGTGGTDIPALRAIGFPTSPLSDKFQVAATGKSPGNTCAGTTNCAIWVDASNNFNMLGNTWILGSSGQGTASWYRAYGAGLATGELSPPYLDFYDFDGNWRSTLYPSTSINGAWCVGSVAPGANCAAGSVLAENPMLAAGDLIVGGAVVNELPAPATPTQYSTGTGSIANSTVVNWEITYINASAQETNASGEETITLPSSGGPFSVTVDSPVPAGDANGWNLYACTGASCTPLAKQNSSEIAIGTNYAMSSVTTGGATAPAANGTPVLFATPTRLALGASGQCVQSSGTTLVYGACGGGGSGTVTNIATTGPISGGPITTTGTISCPTCLVNNPSSTQTVTSQNTSTAFQVVGAAGENANVFYVNNSGSSNFLGYDPVNATLTFNQGGNLTTGTANDTLTISTVNTSLSAGRINIQGGNTSGASSTGANVWIAPGTSAGGAGFQGVGQIAQAYLQVGSFSSSAVMCGSSTGDTIVACPASAANPIAIAATASTGAQDAITSGDAAVNFDAATVTANDWACVSLTTAGDARDNGTTPCSASGRVGLIMVGGSASTGTVHLMFAPPSGGGSSGPSAFAKVNYVSGGNTIWSAPSAIVASADIFTTHSTSTTFIPSALSSGEIYQLYIYQDATGGGVTFSLQPEAVSVTGATWASNVATLTLSSMPFTSGQQIVIFGISPSGYNGTFTITGISGDTLTYTLASNPGTFSAPGTAALLGECGEWKIGSGGSGAINLSSVANAADLLSFTYDQITSYCNATLTSIFN